MHTQKARDMVYRPFVAVYPCECWTSCSLKLLHSVQL